MNDDSHFDEFNTDDERSTPPGESRGWKILIVDDEEKAHEEIESDLANLVFDAKGLRIRNAFSAKEGRRILLEHPDTAVIFLNGGLEHPPGVLDLVTFIREERNNGHVYIILRTGLPDQTPIRKIVGEHEINEYRNRSEFTPDMLYAMTLSGLRSYKASMALETTCLNLKREAGTRDGELAASERRYRLLVETMNEGVGVQDEHGVLTYVNSQLAQMLGRRPVDMIGKPVTDFLDGMNKRLFLDRKTGRRKRRSKFFELEWTGKNGKRIPTLVSPRNILDSSGEVKGSFAVITDISERKKAMEALRKSESRYRNIYHTAPLAFVIWDKTCRITAWNKHAEMIFGWAREEVLGRNFFEFLIPVNARAHVRVVTDDLLKGRIVNQSVNENLTKTGEIILCEWNNSVLYDGEGVISGAISLAMDITERGRTERALKESEAQKKAILDGITTNIRFVNPDYEMLWANRTASFSVDKSPGEMIGRTCYEFWGAGDAPCEDCPTTKVLDTKRTERSIMRFPDGEVWDIKAEPVLDDGGEVMGVIQIAREVTEKYTLDSQLRHAQKMESIGTITSGVAHNFKNILAGISMDSQLVQMLYEDNEQLLEIVRRTDESAKRGARLITELMKFSRKETRKFQTVNLSQVIQETYGLIGKSFDKMIDIQSEAPPSLLVVGDHGGLSQVIMNLCTNARDAMPEGGALRIKAWREEEKVRLVVSDEGCGMDGTTREKCFDPFFTTKEIDRGTGLGLSTTYGIVKDHGGSIHVYSKPGKGAAFKLSFPLASSEATVKEDRTPRVMIGNGEKILIIDDEMSMLQSIKKLLDISGYQVSDAANGIDGVDKYKKWRPDVVLLDRNMPGMNGIDCAEKILEHDPEAKILLISGYADQGHYRLDDHMKSMIKGYLAKPIGIGELSQVLASLLNN